MTHKFYICIYSLSTVGWEPGLGGSWGENQPGVVLDNHPISLLVNHLVAGQNYINQALFKHSFVNRQMSDHANEGEVKM